jgi:hypothetical protein
MYRWCRGRIHQQALQPEQEQEQAQPQLESQQTEAQCCLSQRPELVLEQAQS